MDYIFSKVGDRIKQYREAKGLSQEDLGDMIGISNRHISSVETGAKKPSLSLIIDIANALDVTPDDLLADYLTGSTKTLKAEVFDLLTDCNPTEKAILMETLKHLKKLLTENGI